MIDFARMSLEPVNDLTGSASYRCAAYLNDGLYLPCVVLAQADPWTDLAFRRFKQTSKEPTVWSVLSSSPLVPTKEYRDIVKHFTTGGNRVNHFDVERLEESPYAIARERLAEIRGETSMAWTQFTVEMSDGSKHQFGTTFLTEFFQMPDGYVSKDIVKIHPHPQLAPRAEGVVYRERPFFTCFLDGLGDIQHP